ncbi:unnamed protein product [Rotaria sp. Silwood1]|nr:unnamed protein product [Rotaria sp. Silwood1]CAF1263000.1 unnamed protein product [Rotaria sp. Silwood1]
MIDKNDQRLLSSAHSAVTPRQYRQSSLPRVSRQQSIEKRIHRKKTNSAKSMIIIHTKIRSQNNSLTGNKNNNVNNIDKFPSINDLVNSSHHRQNSKLSFNQSINEWSNNKTQSAHIKSQHSSLSQSHFDQRQIKSSTQFNIDHNRKSKKRTKRLSKSSSKVIPFNDSISRGSIQFNRSSTTKTLNEYSSGKRSLGEYHEIVEDRKKRKKRKYFYCFSCPCRLCCLLCLLIGLFLGILLAVLLLQFLPKSQTTITTTISISTLLTNTSTIGSSTTTSSVTTSSSTTTQTTTTVATTVTSTTEITTTTTTTTTTTNYVCGFSCLNQSWISSTNLRAEWKFDNNLIEDVSNTITSPAQSPTFVTGYVNEALLFDTSPIQSLRGPSMSLTSMSFTIDAWIYPTSFPNSKDHSIVGLCTKPSIGECLYLSIHEDGGNFYLYFGFFDDDCQGNTFVSLNEWIHVAFVYELNSSSQSIYMNGKLDCSRVSGGSFQAAPDIITIGSIPVLDAAYGPNYFQGIIDQVTIAERAKSSCEVLEEAILSAYFTFNSGISFNDSGPNSLSAIGSSVSFVSTGHALEAISFSGSTSSYFQISGVTSLGITNRPFSISLWIRPRSLSGTIVHVSANSSGLGWCYPFLGFTANGSIVAQMYSSIVKSVIGPSVPVASDWTHIVETWSPTNGLRLYVNNILVASTTAMATSYVASSVQNYVTLANSLSGVGICDAGLLGSMSPYNGDIDEFRIYSRELTADDICTLYIS